MKRVRVEFRKSGYSYARIYVKKLIIEVSEESLYRMIGRETYLAQAIEEYIIKKDFLSTNKRSLKKSLSLRQYSLLKAMLKIGSNSWKFWQRALERGWSRKKVGEKILWKVL